METLRVMSSNTLEGNDVKNRAGEDLGNIEEIMIDLASGRVAYAVISFGGFLGLGDKLFAIPWAAIEVDQENECCILDVSKEVLENAPGFDKDHWPQFADRTWATEVHSHYGYDPYWS